LWLPPRINIHVNRIEGYINPQEKIAMIQTPLDPIPIWAMLAATIVFVLIAIEGGYRLGKAMLRRPDHEQPTSLGTIIGAVLALLAFMLAFTFGMAANRFETRRLLVLDEANAIGTTWLRAGMLPEPHGAEARTLLQEYTEVRIQGVRSGNMKEAIAQSEAIQKKLWSQAEAAGIKNPSPITGLFIQSLNDVIDLHAKRLNAVFQARVPIVVWAVLFFITFLSMFAMGYQFGLSGKRSLVEILVLVLIYSVVMWLIVDLDRPGEGLLRVSQQAMVDARNSMTDKTP
jgi:hypothetical protein